MLRWARINKMKKISMLRVNFSGTIGTLDGADMDKITEKISIELGNKNIKQSKNLEYKLLTFGIKYSIIVLESNQ